MGEDRGYSRKQAKDQIRAKKNNLTNIVVCVYLEVYENGGDYIHASV